MAEKDTDAEEAPKKSNKMILIGLVVGILAVSIVGGFFVWNTMLADDPPPAGEESEVVEEEAAEEEPVESLIVSLDPFIVNLFEEDGVRYLKIRLDLELVNCEQEFVDKKTPKIRDSLIILLSSKRYEDIGSMEGKMRLREEILYRLDRVLGEKKTKQVYFTDFVIQ
jgi:flagellar protein FliL